MSRFLAILALVSSPALFAAPVHVYGTGVGPGGALAAGAVDPYFTVTPSWTTTSQATYVATKGAVSQNGWHPDTKQAQWISPGQDATADYGPYTNTFDYTTTFNLVNPGDFIIKGSVAADDMVSILLNGNVVGQDDNAGAWSKMDPFLINSDFVAGLNTLTFRVTNLDGATGLDVAIDPTITPEPASTALMGIGLLGFVGLARFYSRNRQGKTATV